MKDFCIDIIFIFKLFLNKILKTEYFKPEYLENTNNYRKQLFFDQGGGYCVYYLGICYYIQENYSRETLDNIIYATSSAGTLSCFFLCENININIGFNKWIENVFNDDNNIIMRKMYKESSLILKNTTLDKKEVRKNFYPLTFNLNIIFPFLSYLSFSYEFDNKEEFCKTCIASYSIPFLLLPIKETIFNLNHHSKWYIKSFDGGSFFLFLNYFFDLEQILPYGNNIKTSCIRPNTFRNFNISNIFMYNDIEHTERLFKEGYNDCVLYKEKLDSIIL
jgi:hypothetical protein